MFAELSSSFRCLGQLLVSEDSQTEALLVKLFFVYFDALHPSQHFLHHYSG